MKNKNYLFCGLRKPEPFCASTPLRKHAPRLTAIGLFAYATDANCMSIAFTESTFWLMTLMARLFWQAKQAQKHVLIRSQRMTKEKDWKKREKNIAGRLPENSRNRFVDRQSKKTVKKTDQKNRLFIEGWSVIFWLKICISYCCLY